MKIALLVIFLITALTTKSDSTQSEGKMDRIIIVPLSETERSWDRRMEGVMRWVLNAPGEEPQKTHFWNNRHLKLGEAATLKAELMVKSSGSPRSAHAPSPFHHFGRRFKCGWVDYAVIEPDGYEGVWYIGWTWDGGQKVSRIPIVGRARTLEGPGPANFFGIDASGRQIKLRLVGRGRIGEGGPFAKDPLL